MNINLTLGAIVFLAWSTFSSWYYVCKIKGLCLEPTKEVVAVPVEKTSTPPPPETPKEPVVEPINIYEDQILFSKSSTNFIDPAYVESFTSKVKTKIEGRAVEVSIVGYTCDLGSAKYNQALGLRRAESVQTYLESKNIDYSTIKVSSKGESESQPGTEAQRQKVRKVSITIKSTNQ